MKTIARGNGRNGTIVIDSIRDLLAYRREILERLSGASDLEPLFVVEPYRLLEEIGVSFSEKARAEISARR
ncbi:MAG: hypothetical protein C4521_04345 [Actinobacteria bacterium]|nr:MAG: hypothetical protein C4521_04345 [Actinomycetota bacterium]